MTPSGLNSDTTTSKVRLFDLDRLSVSASTGGSGYRCQVCGDEVAFDSLAACCRCSDECYGSGWSDRNARFG